jgi:hypothetical protein
MINTFTLDAAGWQISGPPAYDFGVAVDAVGTDPNGQKYAVIEIDKNFRDGPDPQTGVIPPIVLNFTQMGDGSAMRLFIDDESVANLTGVSWRGFDWVLMQNGVATFNQDLTNVGGLNGFSVAPFSQHQWIVSPGMDNQTLAASGGVVPAGSTFQPGAGPGNLVIDIQPAGPWPMSFSLKELPIPGVSVPEPASLAMMLAGAVALWRRRK